MIACGERDSQNPQGWGCGEETQKETQKRSKKENDRKYVCWVGVSLCVKSEKKKEREKKWREK